MIRVSIDQDACMGNQLCVGEAPDIFELDSGGHARLRALHFTDADLATLRSAEALCPMGAIVVSVDAGGGR